MATSFKAQGNTISLEWSAVNQCYLVWDTKGKHEYPPEIFPAAQKDDAVRRYREKVKFLKSVLKLN